MQAQNPAKKTFQKFITNTLKTATTCFRFCINRLPSRAATHRFSVHGMAWWKPNSFNIVFTKADKLKPMALERNLKTYPNLKCWKAGKCAILHYLSQNSLGSRRLNTSDKPQWFFKRSLISIINSSTDAMAFISESAHKQFLLSLLSSKRINWGIS